MVPLCTGNGRTSLQEPDLKTQMHNLIYMTLATGAPDVVDLAPEIGPEKGEIVLVERYNP